MPQTKAPALENSNPHHHLLCWKSVFAGVLISLMSYMLLSALGAGVLGMSVESAVENANRGSKSIEIFASGTGLWLGLSAVISLFLGSYFSVRISNYVTNKVGAAHGFVVASIFFLLIMADMVSAVGMLSRGVGKITEGISYGTAALASNPQIQDTITKAIGTSNLKSSPSEVIQGMSIRLMNENSDSAKAYFEYQTGMSDADASAKIAQLKSEFDQTAREVGEKSAAALSGVGWALFATFFVGLIGALVGGRVGAHANVDRPLVIENAESYRMPAPARI